MLNALGDTWIVRILHLTFLVTGLLGFLWLIGVYEDRVARPLVEAMPDWMTVPFIILIVVGGIWSIVDEHRTRRTLKAGQQPPRR